MTPIIRAPRPDELDEVFRVDGRNFGFGYAPEDITNRMLVLEPERFRVAVDGRDIVGTTGTYSFEMTLPGGAAIPTAGITWVSVAATHRRRGILASLSAAAFAEAADHGDAACALTSSEGAIYGRFGYGVATQARLTRLDRRLVQLRDDHWPGTAPPARDSRADDVRFVEGDEFLALAPAIYDRYRRMQPGEMSRHANWWRHLVDARSRPAGSIAPAVYAVHRDGFAVYRVENNWHTDRSAHVLHLAELAACTPAAHTALWRLVLGVDLVGVIDSWAMPVDDPLSLMLTDQRALRTNELRDGVWVRVLDVPAVFGTRNYGTVDELVVEVVDEGPRERSWAGATGRFRITGSPSAAACRRVRSRPDLVLPAASLGPLSVGGTRPSSLARGGRLTARSDDVLRRADAFFASERAPHCQTGF